ncbi:L,D-transpeptidase [Ruegeria sediminis]|uniref:L,D-transpeptidase n=1 Tax=Ruegeria sediminis TaxID=2583820 RepID=A0ABY2X3P2_9RHOB|nr:L,D-transpeptidase [Ruegeria sediminis]TMV10006.1 L,D-transpeptidase [Ruegeria sediminis]
MGQSRKRGRLSRRNVIAGVGAATLFPAPAVWAQPDEISGIRRNVSSFSVAKWQDHFDSLRNGAILSDTGSKVLQYWSEDESVYRMYPTSVPLSDDLTKLGHTTIIRKVEGPSWRPTPSMKERNPEWPDFVGPGPDNPLGTHALYLSWQYYRIHGTNDTRKIGRKSSNGCIGLYNEQIAELFELAEVGTQVKLI